jgi:hypothetical protein
MTIDRDVKAGADLGFLAPGNNAYHLRHHLLVDVFNGKCYFPMTPDLVGASDEKPHGVDMILDSNTQSIFSSIDSFSQYDIDNLWLPCGGRLFRLHEIYFMGFKNIINVSKCPVQTYKDKYTGNCLHCMYECDVCVSNDRCEDCRDLKTVTDNYKPCGPRCLLESQHETHAKTVGNYVYWDEIDTNNKLCKWCPFGCKDCDKVNNCNTCIDGYVLDSENASEKKCVTIKYCNDLDGFFVSGVNCSKCDAACLDCEGTDKTCIECKPTEYLTYSFADSRNTCNASCGDKNYLDSSTVKCERCDDSCATCSPGLVNNACLTCADGYYLETVTASPLVTICTKICKYGFAYDTATKVCVACHYSCADCS